MAKKASEDPIVSDSSQVETVYLSLLGCSHHAGRDAESLLASAQDILTENEAQGGTDRTVRIACALLCNEHWANQDNSALIALALKFEAVLP
jgi:hypothetical protein